MGLVSSFQMAGHGVTSGYLASWGRNECHFVDPEDDSVHTQNIENK